MKGELIIIEGPDGIGKSTLVKQLHSDFVAKSTPVSSLSFPGREKGTLGHAIYDLHHQEPPDAIVIDPAAVQCLHIAAHIDAIRSRILPKLEKGEVVILDRFWWSTLVYGAVNGVDMEVLQHMINAEKVAWDNVVPTLAVLLKRDEPFCERPEHVNWYSLCSEYGRLAEKEKVKYPVEVVVPSENVEATSKRILHSIPE